MYGLDTTHPGVAAHLEAVAAAVVDAGFPYLKLDFTFSPSVDGGYVDPARTPAERVRDGFAAIRRGAGPDAFLLGCGVPLANVVGLVDANRIGPDVAPTWSLDPSAEVVAGYLGSQPATAHAFTNTLTRAYMHRRLWLNDPDCADAAHRGHRPVAGRRPHLGPHGGSVRRHGTRVRRPRAPGADARALLDETVALGRATDADARAGGGRAVPTCSSTPHPGGSRPWPVTWPPTRSPGPPSGRRRPRLTPGRRRWRRDVGPGRRTRLVGSSDGPAGADRRGARRRSSRDRGRHRAGAGPGPRPGAPVDGHDP